MDGKNKQPCEYTVLDGRRVGTHRILMRIEWSQIVSPQSAPSVPSFYYSKKSTIHHDVIFDVCAQGRTCNDSPVLTVSKCRVARTFAYSKEEQRLPTQAEGHNRPLLPRLR